MPLSTGIQIVRLGPSHKYNNFGCGDQHLNSFLKRYAWQHHELGYSVTFVAVKDGVSEAVGYITLNASNIPLHQFETNTVEGVEIPAFFPMPTLHICRLAVHNKFQGQGIGTDLLKHAFEIALQAQDELGVGIYAVDLHLADDELKNYYPRLGFRPIKEGSGHYYVPLATIRAAADAANPDVLDVPVEFGD